MKFLSRPRSWFRIANGADLNGFNVGVGGVE
jgi:hypothetical protein